MQITDKLYGPEEIKEKILLDLINSEPIQRLKGVIQSGLPPELDSVQSFSRYEHTIGVLIILRRIGATLEEQIAGILHDISHLAFSHLAEWVLAEGGHEKEDFNESLTEEFICNSEVSKILKSAGYSPSDFFSFEKFVLLKNKFPNTSADRFDYTFRDLVYAENYSLEKVKNSLDSIESIDDEIVFTSVEAAQNLAEAILYAQTHRWGNFSNTVMYRNFSVLLKDCITARIIKREDFWKTDDHIISLIENSKNEEILDRYNSMKSPEFIKNYQPKGEKIVRKFRYLDPKIRIENKIVRLSEVDKEFDNKLRTRKEEHEKGMIV